jgi:hypothetical protein
MRDIWEIMLYFYPELEQLKFQHESQRGLTQDRLTNQLTDWLAGWLAD